jgi:heme-degrading monooxygenase HmoA
MAVVVLIKRKLKPGHEDRLKMLYHEMSKAALLREGYLGSEIMKRVDVDNQMLVISRWKHEDEWTRWLVSSARRNYQEQIDAITCDETKFEIYEE